MTYAFIDIETTGLNPKKDYILELAYILTDDSFEQISPDRQYLIEHEEAWPDVFATLKNAPVAVQAMHADSGLVRDLRAGYATPMEDIATRFLFDVESFAPDSTIHLAGFSVGFDRSFLELTDAWYPLIDGVIHHRILDLSSVKLLMNSAGIEFEKAENPHPHRAQWDVLEALHQARIFKHMLIDGRVGMEIV